MGGVGAEAGEGEAANRCPVGHVRIKGVGQGKKRAHVESGNQQKKTTTMHSTVDAGHPDGDGRRPGAKGGGWVGPNVDGNGVNVLAATNVAALSVRDNSRRRMG